MAEEVLENTSPSESGCYMYTGDSWTATPHQAGRQEENQESNLVLEILKYTKILTSLGSPSGPLQSDGGENKH